MQLVTEPVQLNACSGDAYVTEPCTMVCRAADEMHAGFVEQMEARQVNLDQLLQHH